LFSPGRLIEKGAAAPNQCDSLPDREVSARDREDAERSLVRVAELWAAFSDENYWVYAVK